jgi:flagellar hook-basal body complex protein FliE
MQHVYGVESLAKTNTSATNIPVANTYSAELCSIATDDMSLSNELQNAISAVSVVQNSTSKTTKEFKLGSLHKDFNLFETSRVRQI